MPAPRTEDGKIIAPTKRFASGDANPNAYTQAWRQVVNALHINDGDELSRRWCLLYDLLHDKLVERGIEPLASTDGQCDLSVLTNQLVGSGYDVDKIVAYTVLIAG